MKWSTGVPTITGTVWKRLQFQKGKVSGIIFTGPTDLSLCFKAAGAKRSLDLSSAQSGFHLKSAGGICCRYSCVPDVISIDMYEEQLVQETLEEIGISNGHIPVAHGSSPDQGDFQDALTDFHRYNYFHNGAKICFTNMEKTYEALSAEGIPCIRISVSEDVILEQVYHLQFLENTAQKNRGQSASVQIYFDYSFDQETDLSLREWEKIHYQNEMRELIYSPPTAWGLLRSPRALLFFISCHPFR